MSDIRIGYDDPAIEFELMPDGSKSWQVRLNGDKTIVFRCISLEAAHNLASVILFSVCQTIMEN